MDSKVNYSSPAQPVRLPGACLAVLAGFLALAGQLRAQEYMPSRFIDGVQHISGNWKPHLAAGKKGLSWGNHRAVVAIRKDQSHLPVVRVRIPWRRVDAHPEKKAVVVVDAADESVIKNVRVLSLSWREGHIAFQPRAGSTLYHVYYMPWESTGSYYPKVTYPSSVVSPDASWTVADEAALPRGRTLRIESINDFHSFFPMEVPATEGETNVFVAGRKWLAVPEQARLPIRMRRHIPYHWTLRKTGDFVVHARLDESRVFQVGVFAASVELKRVRVSFSGFTRELRRAMTCFNTQGVDHHGKSFRKVLHVPRGEVQALWIGVQVPPDTVPGDYRGEVLVWSSGRGAQRVPIVLSISRETAPRHGFDDPASQSRLAWLNSTRGRDDDLVMDPYLSMSFGRQGFSILGRKVKLGPMGLPGRITSFFNEEMTGITETGQEILAAPVTFNVKTTQGEVNWTHGYTSVNELTNTRGGWTGSASSPQLALDVRGALEFDGMLDLRMTLTAREDVEVEDITVPVSWVPSAAVWMLGLGRRGGKRPDTLDWHWDVKKHQEGLWLGAVNRGLQYVLRDENYERPLNTNFYQSRPLRMPESWYNEGRGGIRMVTLKDRIVMENYTGPRSMKKGDKLHFNMRFLITPFKTLDLKSHFRTRFVHRMAPIKKVAAWGGTVVNVHHANRLNPYINYPFFNLDQQAAYIEEAHRRGIKVKLYNTIRELTYRAHELFALRSLGDEIFNDGKGGGHSWLQEHLRENYHAAWHAWQVDDAAILNKGDSRWTNYYIEGLFWLASQQKIDGLYLDDIAFGRETTRRIATVLQEARGDIVIDLHSANQFNPRDGFINSAMLYMEHFPFINRLWFGEYFEYDRDEHYWMSEVSGLPFGLTGEMLQDGGHPWRGMLYGMTARMYGTTDPRPVWRLMDDFGIEDSRMLGYWLTRPAVTTDQKKVLATAYVKDGAVLIVLASWSKKTELVRLKLNHELLGLEGDLVLTAPKIRGLQKRAHWSAHTPVKVPANKGLFLVLTPRRQ